MALYPLDGPAVENEISIDAITPTQIKVGASNFEERKVITFQAQTGKVRYGFTNGITASSGFTAAKGQIVTLEASDSQDVFIIAESGAVTIYFAERA